MEKKVSTLEQIQKILQDYKGKPEIRIKPETKFEELQLDSLDTIDLVMEIEDKLGVNIEMSKEIQTVGNIIQIIEKQKKK